MVEYVNKKVQDLAYWIYSFFFIGKSYKLCL